MKSGVGWLPEPAVLVAGEMTEDRSGKLKCMFQTQLLPESPVVTELDCSVRYELDGAELAIPAKLKINASYALSPRVWTEDEIGAYIATHNKAHLPVQAGSVLSFPCAELNYEKVASLAPYRDFHFGEITTRLLGYFSRNCTDEAKLNGMIPDLVSKVSAVCGFHALAQSSQATGAKKFLLVGQADREAEKSESHSRPHVVCLLAGGVKDQAVMVKGTVQEKKTH